MNRGILLALLGCGVELAALGQDKAEKQKVAVSQDPGDMELGLFAGLIKPPNGGSVNAGGGANFAYAVNKYLYPYVEFSVLPGALNDEEVVAGQRYITKGKLADFHGGVHLRLPVTRRFVPYAVFGVGGFKPFSATIEQRTASNQLVSTRPLSGGSGFSFNYGGGIRYYINQTLGVRFEVKGYGPPGKFGGTPFRAMGGVFFQFKKRSN